MSNQMAWMIVTADGVRNYRRPRTVLSFSVQPSLDAQQKPRDVVDHFVAMGWGREVPSPSKSQAPEGAGIVKRARKSRNRA